MKHWKVRYFVNLEYEEPSDRRIQTRLVACERMQDALGAILEHEHCSSDLIEFYSISASYIDILTPQKRYVIG